MSNTNEIIITEKQNIVAIADAVRNKTNTTSFLTLGGIVSKINGIQVGANLPELTDPATEDEVFLNQEYIDENGEKKTGTFTIVSEMEEQNRLLTEQDAKIAELAEILAGKSAGGGGAADMITFVVAYSNAFYDCQAPVGMTFGAWLESEYNPFGITSVSTFYYMGHASSTTPSVSPWDIQYIIMPCAKYFIA